MLALVVPVGGAMVASGALPAADLAPFLLLAPAMAAPVGVIGPRAQAIGGAVDAAKAVDEVLRAPVEPDVAEPREPDARHVAGLVLRGDSASPTTASATRSATSTSSCPRDP